MPAPWVHLCHSFCDHCIGSVFPKLAVQTKVTNVFGHILEWNGPYGIAIGECMFDCLGLGFVDQSWLLLSCDMATDRYAQHKEVSDVHAHGYRNAQHAKVSYA